MGALSATAEMAGQCGLTEPPPSPPPQARECRAAPSELLTVATRHKEAGNVALLSDISGLLGPLFVGAPVRPNVLNMLKSASVTTFFLILSLYFTETKRHLTNCCCHCQ